MALDEEGNVWYTGLYNKLVYEGEITLTEESSGSVTLNDYTRKTIRLWWADGLWDMAMAGFFALTALWIHPLVRALSFPSWTWIWPFRTAETVNPMGGRILLWSLGILPVWWLYAWGAYRLVQAVKSRLSAGAGEVRHGFWLPVERSVYLVHTLVSAGGIILLSLVFSLGKNGPHFLSACFIAAPAGILYAIGRTYRLPRYRYAALAGLIGGAALETLTTDAVYLEGPRQILDVSPQFGNPALPFAVWAVVMTVTGLWAVIRTARCRDGQ